MTFRVDRSVVQTPVFRLSGSGKKTLALAGNFNIQINIQQICESSKFKEMFAVQIRINAARILPG